MHNMQTSRKPLFKVKGFTLIELMIVIAIIAILASIAFPAYQDSVRSARRADAQGALMSFSNAMERYFTSNGTYTGATAAGVFTTQSPVDGGTAYYNLSVVVDPGGSSYTLTAAATGPQTGDGDLTLTNTGARTWNGNDGWD